MHRYRYNGDRERMARLERLVTERRAKEILEGLPREPDEVTAERRRVLAEELARFDKYARRADVSRGTVSHTDTEPKSLLSTGGA
mgnify:CR=1 FL=1